MATEYTEEQRESVLRINRCKDYYDIIGVSKTFSETDLKKQYRKLALALHPDKNTAPGAAEAFKAVSNAFVVLSDPQKRKTYDLYGTEEEQRATRRRGGNDDGRYYYDHNRGFEAEDISPEEIFNMFFGGGFPNGNVHVHRRTRTRENNYRAQQQQPEPSGYGVLLQMMPVLVLLSLSLMSSLFVSDPPFSLQRTSKYLYERKTSNIEVPYFVKDTFDKEYKGSIKRIEAHVEEEYVSNLRTSCFREKNYRESMIWKARSYRDSQLEERAKALRTPSCDKLNKLSQQEQLFW